MDLQNTGDSPVFDYSTRKISKILINEVKRALKKVDYGSVEIYVQDNTVTQISVRTIKKTIGNGNGNK